MGRRQRVGEAEDATPNEPWWIHHSRSSGAGAEPRYTVMVGRWILGVEGGRGSALGSLAEGIKESAALRTGRARQLLGRRRIRPRTAHSPTDSGQSALRHPYGTAPNSRASGASLPRRLLQLVPTSTDVYIDLRLRLPLTPPLRPPILTLNMAPAFSTTSASSSTWASTKAQDPASPSSESASAPLV